MEEVSRMAQSKHTSHCQELEAAVRQLLDAVLFMTGSPSFAPEGEARRGFERLVQPAINAGFDALRDD
jgi:hypothetical protein